MSSIICTLFEGNYHFGVAALTNSLYHNGFRGDIYAGYRGSLPSWAIKTEFNSALKWKGSSTMHVSNDFKLHFLPLETDYHFTNYKPDFMLELAEGPGKNANKIFYFDPDIVITTAWKSFDTWVDCGVALSEDVNSPLSQYHPRRVAWRKYFGEKGLKLQFKDPIYVNGGFVGVKKEDFEFLRIWKNIQELMAAKIGGLNRSSLNGSPLLKEDQGVFSPFSKTDQDALNASIEAYSQIVSFVGKEGMGFREGGAMMPHALGQPKPWQSKTLNQMFKGRPPRQVEKQYWNYANNPIYSKSKVEVKQQKWGIKLAVFVSRFYKRF